MTETQIIKILKGIQGLNFPSLSEEKGEAGASKNIRISNDTIYFTRANNEENVNVKNLFKAYDFYLKEIVHCPLLTTRDFAQFFTHSCQISFFFQILQYFEIVEISKNGVKSSPYTIMAK